MAQQPGFQRLVAVLFFAGSIGVAIATFTLHKEHPLTMEVPRSQYPVGAVEFIREHQLAGKVITFFDWGEMVIFHLPDCSPSMDGRLDTCYPRTLIAEHWKFYNGETCDKTVFNPDDADLALLPVKLAGAAALGSQPGWRAIYYDDVAVLLARDVKRFPKLGNLQLPISGTEGSPAGRAAFADESQRWKKD
jgi:hypothetical protein